MIQRSGVSRCSIFGGAHIQHRFVRKYGDVPAAYASQFWKRYILEGLCGESIGRHERRMKRRLAKDIVILHPRSSSSRPSGVTPGSSRNLTSRRNCTGWTRRGLLGETRKKPRKRRAPSAGPKREPIGLLIAEFWEATQRCRRKMRSLISFARAV